MLLRHIQLMFSSQVKTFKTGKCFVERNNFSVKLACWFHRVYGAKYSINSSNCIGCSAKPKGICVPHQDRYLSRLMLVAMQTR